MIALAQVTWLGSEPRRFCEIITVWCWYYDNSEKLTQFPFILSCVAQRLWKVLPNYISIFTYQLWNDRNHGHKKEPITPKNTKPLIFLHGTFVNMWHSWLTAMKNLTLFAELWPMSIHRRFNLTHRHMTNRLFSFLIQTSLRWCL